MSLVLSLETEAGLSKNELLEAAYASGAVATIDDSSGRLAVFPHSGLELLVRTSFDSTRVLTEGLESPVTWEVGMRISLRYALDRYDECNSDVRQLLEALAKRTTSEFILSFQNESVYAIRNEGGLRFVPGSGLD